MYITIDTSALISVIGNEPVKSGIIALTKGYALCAPSSVHWEIGNALSAMFKRNRIDVELARRAIALYQEIPIRLMDIGLNEALELSHRHGIYAYDAYLIACARQMGTPLLTLDNRLRRAATDSGIYAPEI